MGKSRTDFIMFELKYKCFVFSHTSCEMRRFKDTIFEFLLPQDMFGRSLLEFIPCPGIVQPCLTPEKAAEMEDYVTFQNQFPRACITWYEKM